MTYTLEDCFNRAREFLSTLGYPTLDAITPLDKHMQGIFDNITSEHFAIDFIQYLRKAGVISDSKSGSELNVNNLNNLEFNLYLSDFERRSKNGGFPSLLRRLLQES
jgi:hypothetical protein